ncbi:MULTISPECIES: YgcG family protein [unclassified Roseovarius]|uniref:TPM domain-containing protein n=1 Tax=unclassified Roseovarius TaxID=2614913 RepID=UPI00273E21D0|nr:MULTISPECIES: TPM domain-containing protein [unclassified Roseovarius]
MRILLTLIVALTVLAPDARAQTYPDYSEIYVNDFADLLTDEEEDDIRSDLKRLRSEEGVEFTVVTINTMQDFGHTGAIEPFATGLFNHWGVGDATRNDGVMMLIARFDRKMRIEVGSGYGRSKDAPMKAIIDRVIVPQFRNDNYAAGIALGVDAVISDLTDGKSAAPADPLHVKIWNGIKRMFLAVGNWIYLLAAPLLLLPVQAYRRWKRDRARICPNDQCPMIRLDDHSEDAHLEEGQIVEEHLKSVDYDVWECPLCEHITIEAYKAWFSSYGACRSCSFRTLEAETTTVKVATTTTTGKQRIDYQCHNCHDTYTGWRTTPKKSKSSSSSSSFGGGSSSGGGASGSW